MTVSNKEVTKDEFEFQVLARAIVIKDFDPDFAEMRWEEMWETEQLKFKHIARMQLRSQFTIKDEEPKMRKVLIRGTHPYAYRSGQWAELTGYAQLADRECYKVVFSDGADDLWPVHESGYDYEFKDASE